MIHLRDTVEIRTSPAEVFRWFAELPRHYTRWHPAHVSAYFEGPERLEPGAVLYAEEYLHGRLHRLRLHITRMVPSRRIDYRLGPGVQGSFEFEEVPGGALVTATIDMGVRVPILGSVVDRVLRLVLSARLNALREHMREEGENLKRLLEGEP